MEKEFIHLVNGKEYKVVVRYNRQKNTYFRFKEDHFLVTCSYLTSEKFIRSGLDKYGASLIKKVEKNSATLISFEEKFIYIFGEKHELIVDGKNEFSNESLHLKSEQDLNKMLKKILLQYLKVSVSQKASEMNVNETYSIHVKNMKTRHGSNSIKTHSLNFAISLIHYSPEIIDSVIYHELTHHFVRNHQKKFYDFLLKYCPNYYQLKAKLNRNEVL